ncbi:neurotransmitter-gated ion-channel ligand-binding protein [Bradyrhizobium iriomotense]|uniref:neurotransmitter-gated ion-channel ligand-binding protein n=1 Tax=Bradyrhizobium iriomotense TaxID=441950 RepID=UPI001B8A1123|nr:neurotransmitter-gated ion-channel ligand-binding protein [Bradyrhizobium iriomotense]MBR0781426.1 neurotransmitter-gated ion-channel ligand-binding protein [Bradyrhizobium iriomotense]
MRPFARILSLFLALFCLVAAPAEAAQTELPAGAQLPVRVRVAVRILKVLSIKEVVGEGRLFVEVTQRWTDHRQAFDPVTIGFGRLDRTGADADAYLKSIWTPGLEIENRIGEPEARTVATSTYANGEVMLIERYEARFRFGLNLSAFPFDRQDLTLSFFLPRHAAQDAILISTEADRDISGIEDTTASVDWRAAGLRFANRDAMGWNARSYSKLDVTMTLARISTHYLLRIFVPIMAVLAVSVFVLWAPDLISKDKGSLIFSSLLALAAISFTFESSFPGCISLNTPVAQIISLGYMYLIVVLIVDMSLYTLSRRTGALSAAMIDELRRQMRWALPSIMAAICIGAAVRAIPV